MSQPASKEKAAITCKNGIEMHGKYTDVVQSQSNCRESRSFNGAFASILCSLVIWGIATAVANSMEVVVDVSKGTSSEANKWPESVKGDTRTLSTKGKKLVVILRGGETVDCYPESVILRREGDMLRSIYLVFPAASRDAIVIQARELWPQLRIDDKRLIQDIGEIELGKKRNSSKHLERNYNNLIENEGRGDGIDCVSVLVTKSYSSDNTARFQCHLYFE